MMKITLSLLVVLLLTPVCLLSQNRYDIVIDEIMADPSPQVGLPSNEWIELKNTVLHLSTYKTGVLVIQAGKAVLCPILHYSLIAL